VQIAYNKADPVLKARIAEEAGACAVMALERVPADIRADGGVARMVGFFYFGNLVNAGLMRAE
jgi:pyridoxal biosynthesis lyase PdxS